MQYFQFVLGIKFSHNLACKVNTYFPVSNCSVLIFCFYTLHTQEIDLMLTETPRKMRQFFMMFGKYNKPINYDALTLRNYIAVIMVTLSIINK